MSYKPRAITIDDKILSILEEYGLENWSYRKQFINKTKQAIADEIRACEPEKLDDPDYRNTKWNAAISEYTENLKKAGMI